jgi:hypothetical protein
LSATSLQGNLNPPSELAACAIGQSGYADRTLALPPFGRIAIGRFGEQVVMSGRSWQFLLLGGFKNHFRDLWMCQTHYLSGTLGILTMPGLVTRLQQTSKQGVTSTYR